MQPRNTRSFFAPGLMAVAALSLNLLNPVTVLAQPPAQGPATPSAKANSLPVSLITNIVMNTIDDKVAAKNAELSVDPKYRAHISVSKQEWSPYMLSTTDHDRPNQFFVNKPYIITYTVSDIKANIGGVWVPYPFDRTITQSIDVHTTCEGWYTANGKLTFTSSVQPAYLDGDHSFGEEVFGFLLLNLIPGYVDSQVRGALSNFPVGNSTTTSPFSCSSLGVSTDSQNPNFDAILFDPGHTIFHPVGIPVPSITARVVKVERLALHARDGGPVYNTVEDPTLTFWAGHSEIQLDLPQMVEGQVWLPQGRATVTTEVPAANTQLVLIGSMNYDNLSGEDNGWIAFGSNTNFGNGTRTFNVMKVWFELPTTKGAKPLRRVGAGYAITVQISAPTQPVAAP